MECITTIARSYLAYWLLPHSLRLTSPQAVINLSEASSQQLMGVPMMGCNVLAIVAET